MVLGGTWRLPVKVGLQDKTFIQDQKDEGTYNEASFEREYKIGSLYSLNIINCWKTLKLYKLQRNFEIKISVNV